MGRESEDTIEEAGGRECEESRVGRSRGLQIERDGGKM